MTDNTPTPASAPPTIVTPTYSGPERRSEFRMWREKIDMRLDIGAHAMKGMRHDLDANTKATVELVEILTNFKGAFRVLGWIGSLAKPLGAIAMLCAACLGLWSSIKGGGIR